MLNVNRRKRINEDNYIITNIYLFLIIPPFLPTIFLIISFNILSLHRHFQLMQSH